MVVKQLQRLESQRDRLLDQLEKEEDTKNNLAVEDRVYRLDVKLLELTEKILKGKSKAGITTNDIDEDLVKRVARFILLENSSVKSTIYEDEIAKCAITLLRCTSRKSMMILFKMRELGLDLYKIKRQFDVLYTGDEYNLWDFAKARGYVNEKEFDKKRR